MDGQIAPSGISQLLTDAMAVLDKARAKGPDGDVAPPEGTGEAADGMIIAKVSPPGRVTRLTFNPRVMRTDSETLAEQTMAAVNAALADLQSQVAVVGSAGLGALAGELKEIRENTNRQFASFTDALVQAQERLASRGGS